MKTSIRVLMAASLVVGAIHTQAATDGDIGTGANASSNGNFQINLNLGTAIVVKNLDDMTLDATTAVTGSPIVGREQVCVGGVGFSTYAVNLSSQNGSTGGTGTFPFQLDGTAQNLEYDAFFADDISGSATGDAADTVTGNVTGSYPRNGTLGCTSENAQVIVSIPDWETATETTYSDILTVTVTAE